MKKNILLDTTHLDAVTNISVKILMYIQMFILVRVAFLLEGIQRSNFIIKKEQT